MSFSSKAPTDARAKAESKFHLAERRKSEADQALTEARAPRMPKARRPRG